MRGVNLEEKRKEEFDSIDAINDYFENVLTLLILFAMYMIKLFAIKNYKIEIWF